MNKIGGKTSYLKGTQHLDCSKADFQLLGGWKHERSRAVCADGCVLGAEFTSGVQGSQLAACREVCTPKGGFVCAEAAGCMLQCCCSLREAVPAGFCSDWRKVSCAGGQAVGAAPCLVQVLCAASCCSFLLLTDLQGGHCQQSGNRQAAG